MSAEIESIEHEFDQLDDWQARYKRLIQLGSELSFPAAWRIGENRLPGCSSISWMVTQWDGSRLDIWADSESAIMKGLLSIVLRIYSGRTPEEILTIDIDPLFCKIQLGRHLNRNRQNSVGWAVIRIKRAAQKAKLAM